VITYGYELHRCVEAAERLAADHDISVEIVDVRSLAPLDTATILDSVRKTSRAIVVYEDNRTYGAGAEIAATIAEEALFDLDAPVVRVGGPDIPAMPYAAALEHFYTEPAPDHIYQAMLALARS
jgi:2-oxoisovalerate dehydrogenase E1 component subunit beta